MGKQFEHEPTLNGVPIGRYADGDRSGLWIDGRFKRCGWTAIGSERSPEVGTEAANRRAESAGDRGTFSADYSVSSPGMRLSSISKASRS